MIGLRAHAVRATLAIALASMEIAYSEPLSTTLVAVSSTSEAQPFKRYSNVPAQDRAPQEGSSFVVVDSAVRGKLRQRTVSLYRSMSYGLFCPGTI